ncbi:MAG: hypothetical protein ABFD83_12165 [Armatimonadota bacterium]
MKKAVTIIFVLTIAVTLVIYHNYTAKNAQLQPDEDIRHAVASISPDQIAAIRLEVLSDMLIITPNGKRPDTKILGMQPGFHYKYKTNLAAIALLLRGLKEAKRPPEYRLNRVYHITLIMKDGKVIGPFGFGQGVRVDCFGPTFIKGLKQAGVKNIPRN